MDDLTQQSREATAAAEPAGPANQVAVATVAVETAAPAASTVAAATACDFDRLPGYSRSLLRIKVPVKVSLASRKQTLAKIIEIVPGAILQFDRPFDEALDLEVGDHPVAKGDCVKVGDKFGLRITSLTLPGERFASVTSPSAGPPSRG